ncbi:unnamed protein product [Sphagnum balticum]
MTLRIKAVVENFVRELKAALDADIQEGIMKEREMRSYLEEREREVAEREAAWRADLGRREVGDFHSPLLARRGWTTYPAILMDFYDGMREGEGEETLEFIAEIAKQEARLKVEQENLEKEKSVLMGTASSLDHQDGALEITVSGEKYRCLRFSKAKK